MHLDWGRTDTVAAPKQVQITHKSSFSINPYHFHLYVLCLLAGTGSLLNCFVKYTGAGVALSSPILHECCVVTNFVIFIRSNRVVLLQTLLFSFAVIEMGSQYGKISLFSLECGVVQPRRACAIFFPSFCMEMLLLSRQRDSV
jgi:hypothetical protein